MKKILLFIFLVASLIQVGAQPYGNEWIDPTKTHYKITVSADGLYRINYNTLANAFGANFNALDPRTLVMYHNGQAVPIYVSATGSFGSNDYIEFYGKKNLGEIDSLLYRSGDDQINPYKSLFTNNSIYYLTTSNNLTGNPRFTFTPNDLNPANLPAKERYFMSQSMVDYSTYTRYYNGKYYSVGQTETYKSIYDVGEGMSSYPFFTSSPSEIPVNSASFYAQGPDATLTTRYANNSALENHSVTISFNGTQVYGPQNHNGFQLNTAQINIPVSLLVNGDNTVSYVDNGNNLQSANGNTIGFGLLEYPRDFNFGGQDRFYFQIAASANSKYLEIDNFNSSTQPLLYDITNGLIYRSVQPVGTTPLKFKINPSAQKHEFFLRADNALTYNAVSQLTPVNFINYNDVNAQGEYFIISNKALFDDGNGTNWVNEYRKYRDNVDNPNGGKFTHARIADVDLLYDQFGYGIAKSPLAIRNFINYLSHDSAIAIKMKYAFLIGKGREAKDLITISGAPTPAYDQCLVPTFGYPGSDNLLAASRESDTTSVAIGRLAAQSPLQVRDYLTKMIAYEDSQRVQSCGPARWQKEILHFSGGTTPTEQFLFKFYVGNYERTAEDSLWGAHVTSFSKTTNGPIDVTQADAIREKINNGVSWITFFGHSATGAFDFSIDEPENYTNYGKYPIMLSNGCFSGFIHDENPGYSERFVLQPDKGTIAFMATSSLSVSSGLNNFSNQLYKNVAVKDYHLPLGVAIKQTLFNLFTQTTPVIDDYTAEIAYEMTLHGDPGLLANQYPKPDYSIGTSSVFTNPLTITPGSDSFDVKVVVANNGKVAVLTDAQGHIVTDSITIKLTRTIFDANNNPVVYYYFTKVAAPYYSDTFSFTLPVNISTLGYGQNLFQVEIDALHEIDEMDENCNNSLQTPLSTYIQNDDIIPIYPYEFAIVPTKGVTLKASTVNPFAPFRTYRFQLDTTELFNSPFLKEKLVSQSGGVVRWKTDSTYYTDSTVYYWRVKKDSASALWHYSSFIYLNGEYPGWNQSHLFQYQKDEYQNVKLDSNDRLFKFPPSLNQIHVRTGRSSVSGGNVDYETLGWDYNNYNSYRYRMGGCSSNAYVRGLTFAVIDPVSGLPWVSHNYIRDNYGDKFANSHCADKGDQNGFDFNTTGNDPIETDRIKNFIDSIPNGFYVLMYSVNNPNYANWSPELIAALGNIGFVAQPYVSSNYNGEVVYFTQKGNPNFNPFLADSSGALAVIDTSFNFTGTWYQGNFTSTKIGPAVEWGSVHWQRQPMVGESPANDRDSLDLIGVRIDGFEVVLKTTALANNILDASTFNATTYPYLKLRLRTFDNTTRTPTQLYYWRVLYKKPPEGAINPAAVQVLNMTNNVTQGGTFHLEIPFENVTEVPMDSILTKYVMRDANLNNVNFNVRYDSLPAFDTIMLVVDYPITSNNYVGVNKIIIEANPDNDQIEQYHFNNIAELSFSATGDKINPLLDVTFDNQHILNGDIVSAKPGILITLKDENKYLALDDQSLIDVYIKYPGAAEPTKIVYDNNTLKFYPADPANLSHSNKAQVEYRPEFTLDGTYELLIKNRDRSGNNSATTDGLYQGNNPATFFDYKISFEVITKAMITNVLNYPNPFTTATHFVFTLTGSEVPDNMKIQIVTIKGTVVKEIFKEELGPIHVGRNITEYAWDGRDQYGDLLANGIYFYHVITRLDDKRMDQMSMSYDKYFKKGFGKMAIVR